MKKKEVYVYEIQLHTIDADAYAWTPMLIFYKTLSAAKAAEKAYPSTIYKTRICAVPKPKTRR